MPLTSGPISVSLAIQYGTDFAYQATLGSLAGTIAQAAFCFTYCLLAKKGWSLALIVSTLIFAITAVFLESTNLKQSGMFALAILLIVLVLWKMPIDGKKVTTLGPPWWDLPLRMALIVMLILGVTLIAPFVGPTLSGAIASFPFIATIMAVFGHRAVGHAAAQQTFHGMVTGLFGFATFFYALGIMLGKVSLPIAYLAASLFCITVQGIVLIFQRHRFNR